MTKFLSLLFILFSSAELFSQIMSFEGQVVDGQTQRGIPFTHVYLENSSFGTVTNDTGAFVFKYNMSSRDTQLVFSSIGYEDFKISISELDTSSLNTIPLKALTFRLATTLVEDEEGSLIDLIQKMKRKIESNYARRPESHTVFYREMMNLKNRKIKIKNVRRKKDVDEELPQGNGTKLTEAVLEVYKQPYSGDRAKEQDKIKIIKGRRKEVDATTKEDSILNDILHQASIVAGPNGLLEYEMVRPLQDFDFLHKKAYKKYEFESKGIINFRGRDVIVVAFDQKKKIKKSLYKGVLYIDGNDYALVAADVGLSPRGLPYFSLGFLANTALAIYGLDFNLMKADFQFRYQLYRGTWCLSYAGGNAKIGIFMDKQKRKKEISLDFDFTLDLRLAVTDIDRIHVHEFTEEEMKASSEAMDKIEDEDVNDEFWEQYNFVKLSPGNL